MKNDKEKTMKMHNQRKGFGMIEVLITMAIAAIMLAIAVPNFSNTIAQKRVNYARDTFINDLKKAKTNSFKLGREITVRLNTNMNLPNCNLGATAKAWMIYQNSNNTVISCQKNSFNSYLLKNMTIVTTPSSVNLWTYSSNGLADLPSDIVITFSQASYVSSAAVYAGGVVSAL